MNVQELDNAKRFLLGKLKTFPKYVIVLGSGLSSLLNEMEVEREIPYSSIPHIKVPTVQGHSGTLLVGRLKGTRVACMKGRLHYYEGLSMSDVVFPFRAFAWTGAEVFLLTNAAGGLDPKMKPMDLLLIEDHVNLMGSNPLIGKNLDALGPRFPDMSHLYDPRLRKVVADTAQKLRIPLRKGIYFGFHGPSYETPAEIQMCRKLGGSVVGMSTIPEAIALAHMGKRVVAISCITNLAAGVSKIPLVHDEVLENANKVGVKFARLVKESVQNIQKEHEKVIIPKRGKS